MGSRSSDRSLGPETDLLAELAGNSAAIEAVRENIRRLLARSSSARRLPTILLQGETGTGKGLVARLIHRAGPRATGQFVDVNCAAIPDTLLEAELFGFERGAFTDARRAKLGLFQAAHLGTIFLDEVGLLAEGLQAKLLKVIEEQAVRRLGRTTSEPVDVWIISATNADLQSAIRMRQFREDLYHRLAVLTLDLPPLRERGRDVLFLAERFLARACADYGLPARTLAPAAQARLLGYSWPGNVRELSNVIERVALLAEGSLVTADMLQLSGSAPAEPPPVRNAIVSSENAMRDHLLAALDETGWNVSRTASLLGISRMTVRARIARLGLRSGADPARLRRQPRTALPPESPAPREPIEVTTVAVIRWERRRVTFLRGRLLMEDDRDAPLEASRALEILVEKVRSFGGRIEELTPRGIGAAFGLDPMEDAPRRAVHAAMAIRRAFERTRLGDGESFSVRIGIDVGPVLVGRTGAGVEIDADAKRAQWKVLDDLLAPPDRECILVSPAAAPFLERRFELDLQTAPTGSVGGMYRLASGERTGLAPGGHMAPFVGRHQEIELLRSRLDSARSGHSQIVGIVGDAGIGKSRLLHEFRQSLRGERVTYLEGHCLSYGATIPYLPAVEILRHACRLSAADRPETIARKLNTSLQRLGIEADDALPYLLQFLGVKGDTDTLAMVSPDAIQARTFEILRRICVNRSRQRPLIIAIEDVHWIDTASEALGATIESLVDVALLLVLTYRPGYAPRAERSRMTQIALQPLSNQDSMTVVSALLPPDKVSGPVAQNILAKAEGNPFFLEELARVATHQAESSHTLVAPDTIQEVLLARINRLPDDAKRLLETASIFGREAPRRVLAAVWEDPLGLELPLRELTRQELVYERPIAGDPVYVFKHPLVQEVTYASLLERRRRALHASAGCALEKLYEGRTHEVAELLAHHFGSSDRDDEAVDYALRAAEKAHRRGANTEALASFATALDRLDAMPNTEANRLRRIDVVVKQAEVKFALGRHSEHVRALEGIRDLVEASADPWRRAAWYYWTGFLHSLTGSRPEVSISYCLEASAIAEAGGFEEIHAFAECCLAHAYEVAGRFQDALVAGERALTIFEAHGNVWWACRTLWVLSIAPLYMGDWRRSLDYCHRALAHGEAVNDLRLRVVALLRIGFAHVHRGDVALGLHHHDEALALSPGPYDVAMAKTLRGYGLVKAGDLGLAREALEEAVAWFETSKLKFTRSLVALRLAECYLGQGEHGLARHVLSGVLATSRECGYRHCEAVAERLMGESFLGVDHAQAAGHLEAAARALRGMGAQHDLAKALVSQGQLAVSRGEREKARELLERALQIFEGLETLDDPARVKTILSTL